MSKATDPAKTPTKTTTPDLIAPNTIIKLIVPQAEVKTAYQKVLTKLAKTTKVPGFREGKAPMELAEAHLGHGKLIEKTFHEVVGQVYYQTVVEKKLQPLTQPEFDPISISLDKDWEVEAHFAERPKIDLKDYVKHVKSGMKEAEAELKTPATTAPAPVASASTTAKTPTTAKTAAPAKAERTPEEIKEIKLRKIFRALVEGIKPAIPEMLLRQETRYELEDLVKNLEQLKLKLDDYIAKRAITTQALSNELAATAMGKLQLEFILGAIAAEKKFTAESADYDKFLAQIKDELTRKQIKADAQTMRQLEVSIVRQKVVDHILAI